MATEVTIYQSEQEVQTVSRRFLETARDLRVRNPNEYELAATLITKGAKPLAASIKGFFKEMKADAHKAWRTICDKEREQLGAAEEGIALLKVKMLDYEDAERRRAEAKQAKANVGAVHPATVVPRIPDVEGIAHREEWVVARIEVPELVPREFCSPDKDKLDEHAKLMGPHARVPGVVFEKRRTIAARSLP